MIYRYELMNECWKIDPSNRPDFSMLRKKLAMQMEQVRTILIRLNILI